MIFFILAYKSLRNRIFITSLTVGCIALSVALMLSVERTRRLARDGFTNAISQTDLVVGGRTGSLNLVLFTIFNQGQATNGISWRTYQEIKSLPQVDWTIPYSMGDSHRGFRVIGTDRNFYEHYRFRGDRRVEFDQGQAALAIGDVVIGSDVQKKLGYRISDSVIVTHGVTKGHGIQHHDYHPFTVAGILRPTGTAIDQSVYVTLESLAAIHLDWEKGFRESKSPHGHGELPLDSNIEIDQITSFFVRTKLRSQTLSLQRMINEYQAEPLSAVIPGAALTELWNGLSRIETVLQLISIMVLAIGLVSMVSSLLAGLNERRREMSILRSLGARPWHITLLLVAESSLLTVVGILVGVTISAVGLLFIGPWLENEFGLFSSAPFLTGSEAVALGIILASGMLTGLLPAFTAARNVLRDGLTPRL